MRKMNNRMIKRRRKIYKKNNVKSSKFEYLIKTTTILIQLIAIIVIPWAVHSWNTKNEAIKNYYEQEKIEIMKSTEEREKALRTEDIIKNELKRVPRLSFQIFLSDERLNNTPFFFDENLETYKNYASLYPHRRDYETATQIFLDIKTINELNVNHLFVTFDQFSVQSEDSIEQNLQSQYDNPNYVDITKEQKIGETSNKVRISLVIPNSVFKNRTEDILNIIYYNEEGELFKKEIYFKLFTASIDGEEKMHYKWIIGSVYKFDFISENWNLVDPLDTLKNYKERIY